MSRVAIRKTACRPQTLIDSRHLWRCHKMFFDQFRPDVSWQSGGEGKCHLWLPGLSPWQNCNCDDQASFYWPPRRKRGYNTQMVGKKLKVLVTFCPQVMYFIVGSLLSSWWTACVLPLPQPYSALCEGGNNLISSFVSLCKITTKYTYKGLLKGMLQIYHS